MPDSSRAARNRDGRIRKRCIAKASSNRAWWHLFQAGRATETFYREPCAPNNARRGSSSPSDGWCEASPGLAVKVLVEQQPVAVVGSGGRSVGAALIGTPPLFVRQEQPRQPLGQTSCDLTEVQPSPEPVG